MAAFDRMKLLCLKKKILTLHSAKVSPTTICNSIFR